MNSITPKEKIKGLEKGLSEEEINKLWGEVDFLRPVDHVQWLRHFISLEFGLARLQAGWIPACGHLQWKLDLPKLIFEDMQHVRRLRERLHELPGGTGEFAPKPTVNGFLQAISRADHASSFFRATYTLIKPKLVEAYKTYLHKSDDIFDAPTIYHLEQIIFEKERQLNWMHEFLSEYPLNPENPDESELYLNYVQECLNIIGPLYLSRELEANIRFPASPIQNPAGPAPEKPAQDPELKLLDRFPINQEEDPLHGTLREIVYHNATEWQVIDPMCYIFYGIAKMPLDFFIDFSRHIWDECRHAKMGIRRLQELGYSMDDFYWPHYPTRMDAMEDYFAELTLVGEACSFTRKKGSIVPFLKFGDKKSALLPEVDCVDERLHVGWGRKWVPVMFKNNKNDNRSVDEIARDTRKFLAKNWEHF
ncbi:MAG: DUF455 family protein, partial [Calditrichaeota bacterium]